MPEIGHLGLGGRGSWQAARKEKALVKGTQLVSSSPPSQTLFPVDANTKLGLREHTVFNYTTVRAH